MDMNTGCLWFNNDPKLSLQKKIEGVQALFKEKFSRAAEYCLINIGDAQNEDLEAIGKATKLTVITYKFVMPHNFWMGFDGINANGER